MADFGNEDGLSFYAGGGVGVARTKYRLAAEGESLTAKDSGLAWQLIAGARYAVTPTMDLGLKYRYFRGNKVKDSESGSDFDVTDVLGENVEVNSATVSGRKALRLAGRLIVTLAMPPALW